MSTFAERVIRFNETLDFTGDLPPGVSVLNPFRDNPHVPAISSEFYRKYYSDNRSRHLILGINPGRFGAGLTGIPFTDPKRLNDICGIPFRGALKHEPSSVFIYEMIDAYGGPEAFYGDFYIHSVCPLGFTSSGKNGKEINFNYYDMMRRKEDLPGLYDYIVRNIADQVGMGVETDVCFCFGTGKNEQFLRRLNEEHGFFGKIAALEHPRFIMQYRAKMKQAFIGKYLAAFSGVTSLK